MVVDSGFRIFVPYCYLLIVWIVYGWMRGYDAGLLKYFVIAFACWIIAWNLLGCVCYLYLYYPWTLRTMSNLGLGVHLRNAMMLGFQIVCQIFKFFVILPYLSMLCLWRLIFTWYSEELCIFAIVWFILTSCHIGCHWTKWLILFS